MVMRKSRVEARGLLSSRAPNLGRKKRVGFLRWAADGQGCVCVCVCGGWGGECPRWSSYQSAADAGVRRRGARPEGERRRRRSGGEIDVVS